MISTDYYDILLQGIDSRCTVSRLVHGVSWTAAVLSDGSCGVAMHTTGDTVPRMYDTLIGLPLKEAAGAVHGQEQTYSFHHVELARPENGEWEEWLFSRKKQ